MFYIELLSKIYFCRLKVFVYIACTWVTCNFDLPLAILPSTPNLNTFFDTYIRFPSHDLPIPPQSRPRYCFNNIWINSLPIISIKLLLFLLLLACTWEYLWPLQTNLWFVKDVISTVNYFQHLSSAFICVRMPQSLWFS